MFTFELRFLTWIVWHSRTVWTSRGSRRRCPRTEECFLPSRSGWLFSCQNPVQVEKPSPLCFFLHHRTYRVFLAALAALYLSLVKITFRNRQITFRNRKMTFRNRKITFRNRCHLRISSGTTTKFWVPDHGSRTATMAKFRAFLRNPDLFRTIFLTFPDF